MSIVAEIELRGRPYSKRLESEDGAVRLCMVGARQWFYLDPTAERVWVTISDEWMPDSVRMKIGDFGVYLDDPWLDSWDFRILHSTTVRFLHRRLEPGIEYYVGLQVEVTST